MAFVFFLALVGAIGAGIYYGRKKLWKYVGFSVAAILVSFVGIGFSAPAQPTKPTPAAPVVKSQTTKVTKKQLPVTSSVPFNTVTKNDASLTQGVTKITQAGTPGVRTITYEVTYTNGIETARKQISDVITTAAVDQLVSKGTYVAPVQPQPQAPAPAQTQAAAAYRVGATCVDGSSSSATGSGACSHHHGVSCWQYSDGTCQAS